MNDEELLGRRVETVHGGGIRPLDDARIETETVTDLAGLGDEWRALEARAQPVFFRRWSWIGSLAEERFAAPLLVRARLDGRTMGLALFNRRAGRLALTESGDEGLDAPFIEHNAPLLDPEAPAELGAAMLRAAWSAANVSRLQLGGVAPGLAAAAGGIELRRQERAAPYVDLAALRAEGRSYLAALSANTRYQLRRSVRHYRQWGPLRLERAPTVAQAQDWLAELIELHAAMWRSRGLPGAFATDYIRRFHHAVISAGVPRAEVDLLRCTAGERVIGYLYNVRGGGRVLAYQGGFMHADAGPHGKPGLTCHLLAIEQAMAEGEAAYDFLAGDTRYKRSLTTASETLAWVELVPRFSPLGLLARLRGTLAS